MWTIPVDTTHGELETGPAGSGFGLDLGLSSFTTSRHDYFILVVLSVRIAFKLNFINIRLRVIVVTASFSYLLVLNHNHFFTWVM